ncbi:hypothetical protein ACJX0J_006837 [Zea mays]
MWLDEEAQECHIQRGELFAPARLEARATTTPRQRGDLFAPAYLFSSSRRLLPRDEEAQDCDRTLNFFLMTDEEAQECHIQRGDLFAPAYLFSSSRLLLPRDEEAQECHIFIFKLKCDK